MKRFRALALLIATSLALSACTTASTEPVLAERLTLQEAQERWARAGVTHYAFNLHYRGAWFIGDDRIEVRDGAVIAVTPLDGRAGYHEQMTITDIFARIDDGFTRESAVSATYEATLGYPVEVNIPDPPGWADSGWGATIDGFVRL